MDWVWYLEDKVLLFLACELKRDEVLMATSPTKEQSKDSAQKTKKLLPWLDKGCFHAAMCLFFHTTAAFIAHQQPQSPFASV